MRKIMVLSANDAERGLLAPVCKRIKERKDLKLVKVDISPIAADFPGIYQRVEHLLFEHKPDIVLVPTDRKEMLAAAAAAFYNNFVVAHFDAGDFCTGIQDDMTSCCISKLSHILLANTEKAKQNLIRMGEEESRIHVVGFTCIDDIQPTEEKELIKKYSLPEEEGFNLLLLHPDSYSRENTKHDIEAAVGVLEGFTVVFYPNNDLHSDVIRDWIKCLEVTNDKSTITVLERVPRNDFLGMLKCCNKYVGNSSSACYEATYFGTECVQIGRRNADRDRIKPEPGASDKIVDILSSVRLNEKLLRKRVVL